MRNLSNLTYKLGIVFLLSLLVNPVFSQKITLEIGKKNIALNESLTIILQVENEEIKSYTSFPDLEGFTKRGTSSSSSTTIINNTTSFQNSVTQNYYPQKQGKVVIPAFKMTVNGKVVKCPGATITVGPTNQNMPSFNFDPNDPFFEEEDAVVTEFVDVREDAFFGLSTNKEQVYVGEGFTVTLAFYIASSNKAMMKFHELATQLSAILKKIKPNNCWEENFYIEELKPEKVNIGGKVYKRYKLYQATFYPFNKETIEMPVVGLKMIKYKVAKGQDPTYWGVDRKEDFKTFFTTAKKITIKELPPHPLRDKIPVGDFYLQEQISKNQLKTGEGFTYNFAIIGEGNFASIKEISVDSDKSFDFFPPTTRRNITKEENKVTGNVFFNYYAIPKEPGSYPLQKYFNWIFFSPTKAKYDTLTSRITLKVSGESLENKTIPTSESDDFYEAIEWADNDLRSIENKNWVHWCANIILGLMLIFTLYLIYKRK